MLDVNTWGAGIAAVLDREPRGKYRIGNQFPVWPGLDAETLADAMRWQLGFASYDIDKLLAGAARRKRKITPTEIGRLLRLTAAERAELRIRCIEACDQTVSERRAAAKRRKIENDRRRSKTHHGKSLMKMKPWEAEGIDRATWYRHRKTKAPGLKFLTLARTCRNRN